MNKLSILTALALASVTFVSAQENEANEPFRIKAPAVKQMIKEEGREIKMPELRTGDKAIDAQLKSLNDEMEAKIKAIRDEYVLKIKAIVGSKASTTPRMMPGKIEGSDEGRKLGVPFNDDIRTNASGTLPRGEMRIQNENEKAESAPMAPRFMNFFRGFFGGNR